MRRERAARLKQALPSAIADVGTHATEALLADNRELAERLESERKTVRMVMSTIDSVVDRLLQDELMAAEEKWGDGQQAASVSLIWRSISTRRRQGFHGDTLQISGFRRHLPE